MVADSFLTYTAYISLFICIFGLLYRVLRWTWLPLGPEAVHTNVSERLRAGAAAVAMAVVSPRRLRRVLRALLLEVIFQLHILHQSPRRWVIHMALFYGVTLLVLLHTFDEAITARFFDDYVATLNPFMFLRNLLGLMVAAGILLAWLGRRRRAQGHRTTNRADRWLLVLLAGIVLSGALLEASQIVSPSLFGEMTADYMGDDDPEDVTALKAYWAAEFHVGFHPAPPLDNADLLRQGRDLHGDYCAACHSHPESAVMAYPLVLALKPVAATLDSWRPDVWLWYAHYLISCLALALIPFTKLFHLVTVPVSLMSRALGKAADYLPVNRPARRAMGLDACTHCGECTSHCAVAPIFQVIPNAYILPSEKIGGARHWATGCLSTAARAVLSQGNDICTACGRCTQWCPSGIDLQDLWLATKEDLRRGGYPAPHGWIQRHGAAQWADLAKEKLPEAAGAIRLIEPDIQLTDTPDTFWACVQCATCTNVCPVVAVSGDPQRDLDMTPQQVMNLLRLELKEAALGCRMVWNCVTCYKCQEHCPQGVRVADVLYELRNEACRRLGPAAMADDSVSRGG